MKKLKENILYFAWTVSLVAMLGSLFFSDVLHFPPCVLCWYQRILLYPLVIIIGVGILRKDKFLHQYVLPLSIIGLGASLYHNLLYYSIIPESAAPCVVGISCTTKYINYFGFVTIPLLSMFAFMLITISMIIYKKTKENE